MRVKTYSGVRLGYWVGFLLVRAIRLEGHTPHTLELFKNVLSDSQGYKKVVNFLELT
jgi:hypothetical protein